MALIISITLTIIFLILLGVKSFITNKAATKVVDKILISSGIMAVLVLLVTWFFLFALDASTRGIAELQRKKTIVELTLENVDPKIDDTKAKILAEEIVETNQGIATHQKYVNSIWFKWIIEPLDNYDQIITDNPKVNQAIEKLKATN